MADNVSGLHHTACLFATVVLHAYTKRLAVYHHVFLALTVSSILFHTRHEPPVRIADKFLAHVAFGLVLLDTSKALEVAPWILVFPAAAACSWFAQSFWPERSEQLHAALHVVAVCGLHVYFCVLYGSEAVGA